MTELLPWLNLLLLPTIALLLDIKGRISTLEATQKHHAARLRKIDQIGDS